MKNSIRLILLVIFMMVGTISSAKQKESSATYAQWLDKKHVGHKIKYGGKNAKDSFTVDYLGDVINLKKETFRLVSIVYTGSNKNNASRLLVFNAKNELLGGYGFTSEQDLPTSVKGNRLIFDYKLSKNPCHEITKIDFMHGIPPRLFISCQGKEASIYEFYPDLKPAN